MDPTELDTVLSLQSITEKLLFSMPLSEEIQEKYCFLKQSTYGNLGVEYLPPPTPPTTL
jgi:hypothetical protein